MQERKSKKCAGATGFTLIEIMVVVCLIGLLAAIAVPNYVRSRAQAQTNGCINNLRQIDAAKEQLAMESKLTSGTAVIAASVNSYIKGDPIPPLCPASGSYSYNAIGTNPTCNISGHVYGDSSSSP